MKKCVPFLIWGKECQRSFSFLLEKFVLRLADRVAAAVVIKDCNYSFGGSRAETRWLHTLRYRKQMRATRLFEMAFPIRDNSASVKGIKVSGLYILRIFFRRCLWQSLKGQCRCRDTVPLNTSLTLSLCVLNTRLEGCERENERKRRRSRSQTTKRRVRQANFILNPHPDDGVLKIKS